MDDDKGLEEVVMDLAKQVVYMRYLLTHTFAQICKDSLHVDANNNPLDTNYYLKNIDLLKKQATEVIPRKIEEYRKGLAPFPSVHTEQDFFEWLELEMEKDNE